MQKEWFGKICTVYTVLFVHIATHFLPRNRSIYRRKTKVDKKLNDVNVRAIYGYKQVSAGHEQKKKTLLLLEYL